MSFLLTAIVGGIVGVVIILLLLAALCCCLAACYFAKKRRIKTQTVNTQRRSNVGGGANAAVFSATTTRVQIIEPGQQSQHPQQPPPAHGQLTDQYDYSKQTIIENPGQYPALNYPMYPDETGKFDLSSGAPPPYPTTAEELSVYPPAPYNPPTGYPPY